MCKGVQSRIWSGEVNIAIPSVSYCVRLGRDMSNGREMIIMVGDIKKRKFLIFFSYIFLIADPLLPPTFFSKGSLEDGK